MATHGVSTGARLPPPGNTMGGRPFSCCGAAKWSPIRAHLGPRQDRARARAVVPPHFIHELARGRLDLLDPIAMMT